MSALALSGVRFAYPGGHAALAGVDVALAPGELVGVVGPNGSGKSTLLRIASGLLVPSAGSALVDGRPAAALAPRERARRIAVVPQALRGPRDREVGEFVRAGRYAHGSRWQGLLGGEGAGDRGAVERALAEADAAELAGRRLDELSQGQFQRVLIARALAQEAPLLLFDEPTAGLDPEHQVRVFLLLERLVAAGRAALVVTHELPLAGRFAQRCLVLDRGTRAAEGPPREVFRREVLAPVFGAHLHYGHARGSGEERPVVVPWPSGG